MFLSLSLCSAGEYIPSASSSGGAGVVEADEPAAEVELVVSVSGTGDGEAVDVWSTCGVEVALERRVSRLAGVGMADTVADFAGARAGAGAGVRARVFTGIGWRWVCSQSVLECSEVEE